MQSSLQEPDLRPRWGMREKVSGTISPEERAPGLLLRRITSARPFRASFYGSVVVASASYGVVCTERHPDLQALVSRWQLGRSNWRHSSSGCSIGRPILVLVCIQVATSTAATSTSTWCSRHVHGSLDRNAARLGEDIARGSLTQRAGQRWGSARMIMKNGAEERGQVYFPAA